MASFPFIFAFYGFICFHFGLLWLHSLHFCFLSLHVLSFLLFVASCPFILAVWRFICFHFGFLWLSFGPSFPFIFAFSPFILVFWAFISFHFGLLGLHFFSFWLSVVSFPFILAFWAFISFHFRLLTRLACPSWALYLNKAAASEKHFEAQCLELEALKGFICFGSSLSLHALSF